MNCIQPTAPAELGPRFCPKFVSTLLMAARISHGMPYVLPAACQMLRRLANDIGPAAVGLNETTVPLAGANATAAPRLVCGCTTRKVSAAAVLVTDRASTAPTRAAMRLMATAGR